jgi:hypothetical protein
MGRHRVLLPAARRASDSKRLTQLSQETQVRMVFDSPLHILSTPRFSFQVASTGGLIQLLWCFKPGRRNLKPEHGCASPVLMGAAPSTAVRLLIARGTGLERCLP